MKSIPVMRYIFTVSASACVATKNYTDKNSVSFKWGIPDSTGITGFNVLESAICRTHLMTYVPDGNEDNYG